MAFCRSEIDTGRVRKGIVAYTDSELREMYGDDREPLTKGELMRIHFLKKQAGAVVDEGKPKGD